MAVKHRILGGWSFSPVQYKDKTYVVKLTRDFFFIDMFHVSFFLLENTKKKKVFSTVTSSFCYEKNSILYPITNLHSDEFKKNYPNILKRLFSDCEKLLKVQQEEKKKMEDADKWDGIIC